MQREIDAVRTRCTTCGQATWLVIRTTYLNDSGEEVVVVMPEPVPHDREDCKRFQTLERETWPTLW
jgi:hypothetical protein